jgi:hypothetical protein
MRTRFHICILSLAVMACEPETRVASDTTHAERSPSARSGAEPVPDTLPGTSRGAEEVVRAYYAAINDRDYQRAYDAWGDDGPPGRPTVRAFAAGFAATDSVHVILGAPGRIEGAAGSRYIEIPVRIRAFEHGVGPRDYVGSYTARRSVVSESDTAQRWHLYSATLHLFGEPI